MNVTVVAHNGSAAHRDHNIRNEKVVRKEEHIDPNGIHENWIDEKPRDAYDRIFGGAVDRYNAKQKRNDRKIKSYYNQVRDGEQQHTVYEIVAGVYSKDHNNGLMMSEDEQKAILREYVDTWKERNPNLELIGAYYHADEKGEPHVHCDYVPVAHGYKKGIDTQAGLVKAFGEQGLFKQGKDTAQIIFERKEREALETLCKARNLTVLHLKENGRKHIDTELYKAQRAAETAINQTKELLDCQDMARAELNEIRDATAEAEKKRDRANDQAVKAVTRASRKYKRTIKKDRESGEGWVYDKKMLQDINATVTEIKADADAIKHTDQDVNNLYDDAAKDREAAARERTYAQYEKEQLQADRERVRKKEAEIDKTIDRQVSTRLDHVREAGKREGREEIENQLAQLHNSQGKSFLEIFRYMWAEKLAKDRQRSRDRSGWER